MCEPATIGYGIAALAGGALAGKALAPKIPDTQAATAPSKQTDGKQPDTQALASANAQGSGMNAAPASTFLTGPSGVDPSMLALGKNTLLGQ